jgi:hypothetical protein
MRKITVDELFENLKKTTVEFSYVKNDGTVRKAKGTLKTSLIPENKRPKNEDDANTPEKLSYFDLDKGQWRSVSKRTSTIEVA